MAACAKTGLSVSDVLDDFGRFTVPSLMRMYGHLLKPVQEKVIANQTMCMHRGATRCEILFRKAG